MLIQILDWVVNIGQILLLLTVIIWGIYYRKLPRAIQLFGIYLLLNLIVQLVAHFLWQKSLNNLPLLHLNTLLEFVFVSLFFREVYIDQLWFKKHFIYIISGVALLLILNSVFFESIYGFNTKAKVFVQICLIAYVILYFFDAFGRVDLAQKEPQAISFVCFAILLYYAGSLFIFMFGQFIILGQLKEETRIIWIFNGVLNDFFQLFVLLSFSKLAFRRKYGVTQ